MTDNEMKGLLEQLIADWESEVVEFKRAGAGYSTGEIGQYFSALANEANLRNCAHGWLVFGVDNKTRKVCGTDFDASADALNRPGGLKFQMLQRTDPGVCFNSVNVLGLDEGTVVLFEIPAAPQGVPIAWNGHFYARAGENLVALGLDKLEAIRRQGLESDWSAAIVEDATFDDLDPDAIDEAKRGFIAKHSREFTPEEVNGWQLPAFLDKAQLTRNGRITRTALLLAGKETSAHLLTPHPAQLVWKLVGEECANDIFHPPFLLTTTKLNSRIRNVQVRILPEGRLVAVEVPKYRDESILEALHNCIAHQDYRQNGRIIVTEYVDRLTFANLGTFYEGAPEQYMNGDKMPTRYRNLQLVKAMRETNMIDTMGYGIHRLYNWQAERYFPLPDYKTTAQSVELTIYGHIVDQAYSSVLLLRRGDLTLDDIALLDRIQKGLPVSAEAIAHLRKGGLIEGRKPHWRVSARIASDTGAKAAYMKKRGFSRGTYQRMLIDYLKKFNGVTRKEINEYLADEIRGDFTMAQKLSKITNILTHLRKRGKIRNLGSDTKPLWVLNDKGCDQ